MSEKMINRKFMKSEAEKWNSIKSDQMKKIEPPPLEKPYDKDDKIIDLPLPEESVVKKKDLFLVIGHRKSIRKYQKENISLEELSFLLWATQGVKSVINNVCTMRNVPSAGARHVFETYLFINNVTGLKKGLYRYLPIEHKLVFIYFYEDMKEDLNKAVLNQAFVTEAAVTFIWSCIPYRAEWRYDILAHKHMLIDIGHVCQNLYLAAEAIDCGTCAIGAYDQNLLDNLLKLNGEEEFALYLAPVGKK